MRPNNELAQARLFPSFRSEQWPFKIDDFTKMDGVLMVEAQTPNMRKVIK